MPSVHSHASRTLRLFHCKHCNHHLRFGSSECGYCFRSTPLKNRKFTWALIAASLLIGLAIITMR